MGEPHLTTLSGSFFQNFVKTLPQSVSIKYEKIPAKLWLDRIRGVGATFFPPYVEDMAF